MDHVVEESFEDTLATLESGFVMPPDPEIPVPKDTAKTQLDLFATNLPMVTTLKAKCLELTCNTPKEYEVTRQMLGTLRTLRGRIEKRRKQHNEEAQQHIKWVNSNAKELTVFIENLEAPLKQAKLEVDDAKERAKRAAEEAEQERLAAIEREKLAAAEAERQAAHAAEQERLRVASEALKAERAEMEAERRRMDDENRQRLAEQLIERQRVEEERQAVEVERRQLEQAEKDRLAKIEAARLAAEAVEREKQAAAERDRRRLALAPDAEKIGKYAKQIMLVSPPEVTEPEAQAIVNRAVMDLAKIANDLAAFSKGQ